MAGTARDIYVLPSVAPTADALLRETIVYLTCLHESGHAFGLPHTRNFADIMYSFQCPWRRYYELLRALSNAAEDACGYYETLGDLGCGPRCVSPGDQVRAPIETVHAAQPCCFRVVKRG